MARRAFGAQCSIRLTGGSAKPQMLAFCPSVLPVKISIAQGGLNPLRKLLRGELRLGSHPVLQADRDFAAL